MRFSYPICSKRMKSGQSAFKDYGGVNITSNNKALRVNHINKPIIKMKCKPK